MSFTRATVRRMRRLALRDQVDPDVRRLALRITESVGGQDAIGQASAIRGWLMNHVSFTRDPRKHELLIQPRILVRSLRNPANHGMVRIDCDDVATLAATLGGAIGLDARFVVVSFNSPLAHQRHVWAELATPVHVPNKQWYEMDVTRSFQGLPPKTAISDRWVMNV
jgi:transglutaminase-like putative cysteine protease